MFKVGAGDLGYYVPLHGDSVDGLVEPAGIWRGRMAHEFGIARCEVTRETFSALLDGRDPHTGEVLNQYRHRIVNRAYDLLVSAPKSVSILYALGSEPTAGAIRRAHESSVDATVEYLERNVAMVQRRRNGVVLTVASSGLFVAGFRHRVSRAPDPHLHTHLVIANLGCDVDGRWSALDARELFTHATCARMLYCANLRHELSSVAGLTFAPRSSGTIDLIGARKSTIRLFSRRGVEIAEAARELGVTGGRANKMLSDRTRPPKDPTYSWDELIEQWWETAHRSGLTRSMLEGLGRPVATKARQPDRDVDIHALVGAFERPFSRRELLACIADRATDGMTIDGVERTVDALLETPPVRRHTATYMMSDSGVKTALLRGVPEQRWVSAEVGDAMVRIGTTIAAAPAGSEHPFSELESERRVTRVNGDLASLGILCARARDAIARGEVIAALAPTAAVAGHFEAVTGIETATDVASQLSGEHVHLVLYGAGSIAPRLLDRAISAQMASGGRVVVVDRSTTEDGARLRPAGDVPDGWDSDSGIVHVVFSVESLAGAARSSVARWRARGYEPVVLMADGADIFGDLGAAVMTPRRAAERARTVPSAAAVVIGDERVLGSAARRSFGDRRVHVVVDPVVTSRRALLVDRLAVPQIERTRARDGLVHELGR